MVGRDIHRREPVVVHALGHATQALEFLFRDLSARETRGPQRPEQFENVIIEAVVDEDRFVLDRAGNAAGAKQRGLAHFLKGQNGQVEGDVRKFFVVKHALRGAQQIERVAKTLGCMIWFMAVERIHTVPQDLGSGPALSIDYPFRSRRLNVVYPGFPDLRTLVV